MGMGHSTDVLVLFVCNDEHVPYDT